MGLNNCNYNCTHHLTRKLAFLSRVGRYIKDASDAGHPACVEVWKKIKVDEEQHVEMLRQAIEGLSREGKFN